MKKIGILGGTFNPIHHGHLILGQAAKEEFGLDEILVMPTKNPAYKKISGGVSEKNRVDMIKLAIRDFPYFKFSDICKHCLFLSVSKNNFQSQKYFIIL